MLYLCKPMNQTSQRVVQRRSLIRCRSLRMLRVTRPLLQEPSCVGREGSPAVWR